MEPITAPAPSVSVPDLRRIPLGHLAATLQAEGPAAPGAPAALAAFNSSI